MFNKATGPDYGRETTETWPLFIRVYFLALILFPSEESRIMWACGHSCGITTLGCCFFATIEDAALENGNVFIQFIKFYSR